MEREPIGRYEIREATLTDVPEVRRMHAESWLATYPSEENGVPYSWVEDRVKGWLTPEKLEGSKEIVARVIPDPAQFYRLAVQGDKIVGFVHAATNDDGTKELQAIYTDPGTFGTGLGQQLMERAIEWIGDTEAALEVATYNLRAIRFYEKYGFKKVEGSEHLYADKIPIMKMKREGSEQ